MKTITKPTSAVAGLFRSLLLALSFCLAGSSALHAQGTGVVCPNNLDFSGGNFNNWLCYTGTVSGNNTTQTWSISLGAPAAAVGGSGPYWGCTSVTGTARHAVTSGTGSDCYGGFPEVAPGGGLFSARIGNDKTGAEGERIRYVLHVPAGFTNYSFNFKYAVVLEDPGTSHQLWEKPRFDVVARDSVTGDTIKCASQTFISSPALQALGFQTSSVLSAEGLYPYYLPWTTGNLNLSAAGGKTVYIDVTSGDCTQSGHWGYGYFDVISCGQFNAAITYCDLKKGILTLQAPNGYAQYKFYNQNFTTLYSVPPYTAQSINVSAPNTPQYYNVVLTPFAANGCPDTIKTKVLSDFQLDAKPDTVCNTLGKPLQFTTTVTGGIGGFKYNWTYDTSIGKLSTYTIGKNTDTLPNPIAYPVQGGYYVVTVSDSNSCFRSDTVRIQNPSFHIDLGADVTTCLGTPVNINPKITPVNGPGYIFTWSPGNGLSNTTIANPTYTPSVVGTQRFIVRLDSGICATADTFNIRTLPNTFTPVDTAVCEGSPFFLRLKGTMADGSADTNFKYTFSPFTKLTANPGGAHSDRSPEWQYPDTTTTFVVTAKYPTCPDIVRQLTVRVEPKPRVFLGADTVFKCLYQPIYLTAQVFPTWYTEYSYTWRANDFIDKPNSPIIQFTGIKDTTLRVTVRTPLGCNGRDSVRIHVYAGNFGKLSPIDPEMCPRNSVTLTAGGGVSYRWEPALYLSNATNPVVTSTPVTTTPYTLYVTDKNGCIDTLHTTITVNPEAVVSLPDSITLWPGESYQLNPQGNALYYNWFPTVGLTPSANVTNPVAAPTVNTRYFVTGTTEAGCKASDSIYVLVRQESVIGMANAFSPGSEPNGIFKVSHLGTANLRYFRIFNRWGTKVFETNNINQGWDGTFNGTPQPMGVYIYTVEAQTNTGTIFTKQGNVTLVR